MKNVNELMSIISLGRLISDNRKIDDTGWQLFNEISVPLNSCDVDYVLINIEYL